MRLSSQILIAFSLIIMISIVESFTNFRLSQKVEQNIEYLSKSETIIRNSNRIHKSIIEMQSAFRGFLLTEDSLFLYPYNTGLTTVPELMGEQRKLVETNHQQTALLDSIQSLHSNWISYANSLIITKKRSLAHSEDEIVYNTILDQMLKRQVGKKLNDEIRDLFVDFDKIEYSERNQKSANLIASMDKTHASSLIFLILTILIGAGSTLYILILISYRIKSMVNLADNITKGNFNQITDHRKDELTSLSKSLNIMSSELSKNIHELQNKNVELNKFAYVVSHDLKAPVRGIHNVVKWIEEDMGDELSPQLKQYLQIIPQRTRRMEDLINGLLAYARINEKTNPERISVHDLVHEIADSIVPRNFKMELENLPFLFAERIKLEQVFTNIISNAIKYNNHKEPYIRISSTKSNSYYTFSIEDNGMGISPEYHEKIFDIFQTLREKDEMESTGIGLSIVKKIIEEQKGTILVKSSLGQGATFIFTWPESLSNT